MPPDSYTQNSSEIAIVGVSVELPSGSLRSENLDHETFFQFLLNREEAYEEIPGTRFNVQAWKGSGLAQVHVDRGAFLKHIDMFDNVEFGISSRDAEAMAPSTKKLIENCFLALLDSGIDYRMRNVGCYTSGVAFELSSVSEPDEYDSRGSFAGYPSMIANRVSTHLDLLGPSVPTDTACSSTLTAFHLAVQAIQSGDCEAAVVGGCQLNHRFTDWITYSQGSLLAPDGKCKPFDASANGFSRAEGCVAVVIKPLEDAIRDNDKIYATVLGTSINSSGAGAPPGAPVAEAQCSAMTEAFKRANRQPKDVDFVELHATGTSRGDPVEANWVGERLGNRERELIIGSVKGNVGHTEITAFLASLSKVLSIFEHGIIPPNANFEIPNPSIEWEKYNMRVLRTPLQLPSLSQKPLISIASSGIGGSNGHVVLEGAPERPVRSSHTSQSNTLLVIGGLTPRTVSSLADSILDLTQKDLPNAALLSTIMGRRSKQMSWRSYTIISSDTSAPPKISIPQMIPRKAPPIVFVFSGQGPQHANMGRELFKTFPVFRQSVVESDEVFRRLTGQSLLQDYGIFSGDISRELPEPWPISLILPSIAIFQMALFDLLVSLGISPDIIVGHSAGETAVLYASGAAPKAMAVELSIIRGQTFTAVEPHGGTMAALSCSSSLAEELIEIAKAENPGIAELACFNSPSAVAISGHETCIDHILTVAQQRGIFARKIRTRVPIHSSMMNICREDYQKRLQELFSRYPGCHLPATTTYSTLTGTSFKSGFNAEYFWDNTRNAVRFTQAMESIGPSQTYTFIEIAPHPVLSSYISSMYSESCNILCPVRRPKPQSQLSEHREFLEFLGKLTIAGHNNLNFTTLNGRVCYDTKITLPPYPFLKKQFPLYPATSGFIKQIAQRNGPINHPYLKVNKDTHPVLAEHVVRGEPIMPAAGFIEMGLEFGASVLMNVNLKSILPLSSEKPVPIKVTLNGLYWSVKSVVLSRSASDAPLEPVERLHADGYLSFEETQPVDAFDLPATRKRCDKHVSAVYPSLSYFSSYGPRFRRITNFSYGSDEALCSIVGMDETLYRDGDYILHPAILDACLHVTAYRPFHGDFNPNVYYLPARVEAVILHTKWKRKCLPAHIYAHLKLTRWSPDSMAYNITLVDEKGQRLCTLKNLEVDKHRMVPKSIATVPLDVILQPVPYGPASLPLDPSSYESVQPPLEVALEKHLTYIMQTSNRRVVRLFISTNISTLLDLVTDVLQKFPSLFFLIFVEEESQRNHLLSRDQRGRVHVQEEPASLDLVLAYKEGESYSTDQLHLHHSLLVPGGTLIVENEVASSLALLVEQNEFQIPSKVVSADGRHVAVEVRKSTEDSVMLYHHSDDFVFEYTLGEESSLQWEFSGLNVLQKIDIWILVAEGPDAGAAQGLVRALRREYGLWTFRLVIFPSFYTEAMRMDTLEHLPSSLSDEPEIYISCKGTSSVQVPRMLPIPPPPTAPTANISHIIPAHSLLGQILTSYDSGDICGFVASVIQSHGPEIIDGSLVMGLVPLPPTQGRIVLDADLVCPIPFSFSKKADFIASHLPGLVIGVLAPGPLTFQSDKHFKSLRILLTHADTVNGSVISRLYSCMGAQVTELDAMTSPLQLASAGYHQFDLVVSGHVDSSYIQLLQTLLCPTRGKLFLWNSGPTSLSQLLLRDPANVRAALDCAVGILELSGFRHHDLTKLLPDTRCTPPFTQEPALLAKFHADKIYLLIGGIGSIGVSIAKYLYECGAKRIILTSRSGEASLDRTANRMMKRVVGYLLAQDDLRLELKAVDGTCASALKALIESCDAPLGGCIILSTVLADGVFARLNQEDFTDVFNSKSGVFRALADATNLSLLDFVVGFSSVSGAFGVGGQSNYGAANTALEYDLSRLQNGFSFVCPGIIDSTLMLADGMESKEHLLRDYLKWSTSMEDMLTWLDDAIHRTLMGQKFSKHLYIPNLDWNVMNDCLGMTKIGHHLISSSDSSEISDGSVEGAATRMTHLVQRALNISPEDFSPDLPLTSYGLDSLSASKVSVVLRPFVEVTQIQLLADLSLNGLLHKMSEQSSNTESAEDHKTIIRTRSKGEVLAHYLADLASVHESRPEIEVKTGQVILLTGTTGSLGCNILAHLLSRNDVSRVFAFNRQRTGDTSLITRQSTAFVSHGFSPSLSLSAKLALIEGDLTQKNFGLTDDILLQLSTVTHIIHNAWTVNFANNLEDFDELIQGTCNLINFAGESGVLGGTSLSFISSVAVYHSLENLEPAPEAPITNENVNIESGYLESKWIAERLVQIVAQERSLKANVIRTGLLSGGQNGHWDVSNWVPALVESALYVRCLPDGDGLVSWIPLDLAAAAIVDMQPKSNDTLHLIHPKPTAWHTMMKNFASRLRVPLVPYREWLARLEYTAMDEYSGIRPKALRILQLYRRGAKVPEGDESIESMGLLPNVSADKAKFLSASLADPNVQSLGEEDVDRWIEYWRSAGFLPADK